MLQHERMDHRQMAAFAIFTPDCNRQAPQWPSPANRPEAAKPTQTNRKKAPADRRFLAG